MTIPDRRPTDLTLANWDLGGPPSAWAYLHAGELLPSVDIAPAPRPVELDHAEQPEIAQFPVQPGISLEEYVHSAPVSGIVVVSGGQIVFERYPRMRPDDRHLLMSVTKVSTSAIVGILERRGLLDLSRPADSYIGELAGSGWAGVTVNDVLSMASGIDCLEIDSPGAYTEPGHPFYRFEASLGWRPAGGEPNTYDLIASLPSHRRAGLKHRSSPPLPRHRRRAVATDTSRETAGPAPPRREPARRCHSRLRHSPAASQPPVELRFGPSASLVQPAPGP